MNTNELQHIKFEIQDKVALITLNRPEQMNTWTPIMSRDLSDAMYECDENDTIRAVVITGAGRAFCAGADLSGGEDGFTDRVEINRPPMWPYQIRKPVIAAINGAAVGVGITYSMLADMRLATPNAKIGFAMVRRGYPARTCLSRDREPSCWVFSRRRSANDRSNNFRPRGGRYGRRW
jgi:enoyl-CoA hydratase/carnithine racemase